MLNLFMMGSAFSQGKHSLSLGLGNEKVFNEMIIPYNFSGVNLSIDYNYENYMKRNWKTFFDINVAASPSLGLTQKFSNNTRFNSPVLSLDISVNKLYLKKLVEIRNFSFHAGIISSLQFNYQVTNSAILPNSTIDGSAFLRLDLAAGLSTSAQLKYKKFLFQNTASYLLLSASLYPNYSDDIPIFNDGRTK
ncbi:MAG: hypothetical protein LBR10_10965, partial [Prevotellaceae bacterium]|nr:hypothetical protein [Prevotellaceae bacterium]